MALIDWLDKMAPLVVAIEEDLGLDTLKSAVPGIGLLVGVAKWAQKKGATPKAIKELCEKHGIVPEKVSSLEIAAGNVIIMPPISFMKLSPVPYISTAFIIRSSE